MAVTQYIVTITPVVDSGEGEEDASRTTMRVIVEDGQVYIRELTVRVAENTKLGPGEVMQVDLDILLRAFARRQQEAPVRSQIMTATRSIAKGASRGKDRAYRRMPDPAEVKATYLASRTITGVAEHYGVPTHTAQGWVGRLRRKGVIPAGK
jgi:hypothetical protein